VEVKHYAEDHINSGLLTNKTPQIIEWWLQAVRQGIQVNRKPLLIFKFNRSKMFVAHQDLTNDMYRSILVSACGHELNICLLTDWLTHEQPKFIK
jgi:hypothetical protein